MNIATITQGIAAVPEVIRETAGFVKWNFPFVMARIAGDEEAMIALLDGDDDDHHHMHPTPYSLWESGRRALEFVMLVKSSDEHHDDFHTILDAAAGDINNIQHAVDIIMALANMVAASTEDEDIDRFSQFFLEAEAGAM